MTLYVDVRILYLGTMCGKVYFDTVCEFTNILAQCVVEYILTLYVDVRILYLGTMCGKVNLDTVCECSNILEQYELVGLGTSVEVVVYVTVIKFAPKVKQFYLQ